jgi:hypothetical protein
VGGRRDVNWESIVLMMEGSGLELVTTSLFEGRVVGVWIWIFDEEKGEVGDGFVVVEVFFNSPKIVVRARNTHSRPSEIPDFNFFSQRQMPRLSVVVTETPLTPLPRYFWDKSRRKEEEQDSFLSQRSLRRRHLTQESVEVAVR